MCERTFFSSIRIICSSTIVVSVLMFLLSPCGAADFPSPPSSVDAVGSDKPESGEKWTLSSSIFNPHEPLNSPSTTIVRPPIESVKRQGVDWKSILVQSTSFLAIEQGFRLGTQPGTRNALKGPFFDDWFKSVKATKGWGDGDDFLTNYIGHPMEGSVVSNIFVHNDPRGRNLVFSWESRYWNSRLKAMAWSAIYSTQFELGPISEASLGNVGYPGSGSYSGAVDLVVTPLAGLGWQVGEDAIDKYLVARIETWTKNPVILMFARGVLNPTRSFANAMRMTVPWARDTRPGIWKRGPKNR
jgi:hypothetical protein